MTNMIIELKCIDCVKLDKDQFVVSFNSVDNEKYQMTFNQSVPINTIIRLNTYYHTIQKFDDYFRISIKQDYIAKEKPIILELFLADKYETKDNDQISVYKDSNTLEIFKMVEKGNQPKLNSTRLINIEKEKLVIIKKPHIFNGNYIIENWIHQFENK
jgi:hypothetical protein